MLYDAIERAKYEDVGAYQYLRSQIEEASSVVVIRRENAPPMEINAFVVPLLVQSTSSFFWFRLLRIRRPNSTACSASTVPCDSLSSCSARLSAIVLSMRATASSLSSGELDDLRGAGRLFLGMVVYEFK